MEGLKGSGGNRRQRNVGGTFETERGTNKIFDKFIFLGLPPNVDIKKPDQFAPKSLFEFPSNTKLPFDVIPFCFPEGALVRMLKKTTSLSDVHNVMYGQLAVLESSNNSFIFLVTCEQDVYYVICVVRDEILENLPPFAGPSESMSVLIKHCTPRVYCIVSRFPFFRLHFDVLYGILARDRLSQLENRTLSANGVLSENKMAKNKSLANDVVTMLEGYYVQSVPQAGQSLSFKLPGHLYQFDFLCPSEDDESLLSDWCFPTTISVLTVDRILLLLSAAMLERTIVIVCENRGVLSSIILSIIPLLRPFIWQGPLIPILPASLYEYLQAPVPYIVGVLHLPSSLKTEVEQHALVIYVDNANISEPKKDPILPMPFIDSLLIKLQPIYQHIRSLVNPFHDPYKTKADHIHYVREFFSTIKQQHAILLSHIREVALKEKGLINWESQAERDKLAAKLAQDTKTKLFYSRFFFTQAFLMYYEENGLEWPINSSSPSPSHVVPSRMRASKDLTSTLQHTNAGSIAFFVDKSKSQILERKDLRTTL